MKWLNMCTLQSRITTIAVASTVLVSLAILVSNELIYDELATRFRETTLRGKAVLWNKIIDNALKELERSTSSLTRDRESLQALQAGVSIFRVN